MSNWSNPTVDSAYTDVLTDLKDRDLDVAKGLDPAVVTVTNPSTNMIRWDSANNKWQKYNGTTWNDLTATYSISISGTAGAVAFANITGKPTTLSGYGITDAQALDSDLSAVAGLATTGLIARTGAGTAATRSIAAPAAGITVADADGVAGNPTLALANDLLALENLSSSGIARRVATSTWTAGTAIVTSEIGDDQVTYAKVQNVSTHDRILGRVSSGAGDIEEITCTPLARTLLDDSTLVEARTTLGMFPSGTRMAFNQTSAPTGWTKETSATYNDAAIRLVTGSVSTGGADAFSSLFGTGKSTAGYTLQVADMPNHTHGVSDPGHTHGLTDGQSVMSGPAGAILFGGSGGNLSQVGIANATTGIGIQAQGGGGSHSHTLNNFNLKFVGFIIATKN